MEWHTNNTNINIYIKACEFVICCISNLNLLAEPRMMVMDTFDAHLKKERQNDTVHMNIAARCVIIV